MKLILILIFMTMITTESMGNIGQFEDVNNFIIDSVLGSLDDAKAANENIETTCAIEDNQKLVNDLYLNKLIYESDTLNGVGAHYEFDTTEIAQLEGVAYQNPALGGKSVYLARILLWKDVMDDNSTVARRFIHNTNTTKRQARFKFFPNPNNGSMTLEYKLADTDIAEMSVYDVTGRLIKNYPLNSKNSILNINESELKAGIYYYNIRVNEKLFQTSKIVIIK